MWWSNVIDMNASARSPQLCLKRLQGLSVFLLAGHLQNRFVVTGSTLNITVQLS